MAEDKGNVNATDEGDGDDDGEGVEGVATHGVEVELEADEEE